MQPADLAKRCSDLRLPQAEIARLTLLDADTVGNAFHAKCDPRTSTLNKIVDAVITEELRLLTHLIALHPQEAMVALCPERREQSTSGSQGPGQAQ